MAKRNFFFSLPLKMIKNKRSAKEEEQDEQDEQQDEQQEISRIFSSLKQVILT
jgi:hypothetical protein